MRRGPLHLTFFRGGNRLLDQLSHERCARLLTGEQFELEAGLTDEHFDAANRSAPLFHGLFEQKRPFGIVYGVEHNHSPSQFALIVRRIVNVRVHSDRCTVGDDVRSNLSPSFPVDDFAIEVSG